MTSSEVFGQLLDDERGRNAFWMARLRLSLAVFVLAMDVFAAAGELDARRLFVIGYIAVAVAIVFATKHSAAFRTRAHYAVALLDLPALIVTQHVVLSAAAAGALPPLRVGGLVGFTFASLLTLVTVSALSLRVSIVVLTALATLIGQLVLLKAAHYDAVPAVVTAAILTFGTAAACAFLVHRVLRMMARAAAWFREVSALTATLEERKMAALGQLIAGVAHDLNTPIGSLRSSADTSLKALKKLEAAFAEHDIEDRKLTRSLEVLRRSCETSLNASERVTGVVDALRSFSHLDEANRKRIDIHQALDATVTLLDSRLGERIHVRTHYADVPEVACYPLELNQAFMHVLVNAIEAIDGKGTIDITTDADDEHVIVRFRDSGCGIDPNDRDMVFDPGFTTKGVGTGGGMGLAISYQVLSKHDGTLALEESTEDGSTFVIRLRRVET